MTKHKPEGNRRGDRPVEGAADLNRALAIQLHERDSLREIFDLARCWHELAIGQREFVLRNLVESAVAFKPPRTNDVRMRVFGRFSQLSHST